jgi:drug/metabolite transporter (DMT)-like permease
LKTWKAELFLLLITFIWGGTFTFTKVGLDYCPPALYIIFRFSIALLISLIIFGRHLKDINKKILLQGLLLGFFFGSGFVLQTYGLKLTTISKSAFITGITVVLTPFVFFIIERTKIQLWQKAGVLIASVGLWLFTDPQFDDLNIGDVLTLGSCVFWALYITFMDVFTKDRHSVSESSQLVIFQFVMATPLTVVFYFLFDTQSAPVVFSNELLYSLAYNGIIASFILTFIHTSVQKYTTPVKAALIFSLEPVVASYVAILFMHETLNTMQYLGGIILMISVVFSQTGGYLQEKLVMKFSR